MCFADVIHVHDVSTVVRVLCEVCTYVLDFSPDKNYYYGKYCIEIF